MHESAVRRLQISSDVRDAINEPDQFRVAFQPLVRLTDWKTVGYEALVRWQHPREGMIQPDLFIPAAKKRASSCARPRSAHPFARALSAKNSATIRPSRCTSTSRCKRSCTAIFRARVRGD